MRKMNPLLSPAKFTNQIVQKSMSKLGMRPLLLLAVLGVVITMMFLSPSSKDTANNSPYPQAQPNSTNTDETKTYTFCFWNVENLFDDKDDKRREVDEEYDNPFAKDGKLRQQKLDRIATALLKMNNGIGPDIIAFAEVESVRAADLLRGALNAKLEANKADPQLKYTQVSMKNIGGDAGRHISTGLISRLPVAHQGTRAHGRNLRILESHIVVNGHDLTVLSSHWTSQKSQSGDNNDADSGRGLYAATIYDVYSAAADRKKSVDFLVCGDFNCAPESGTIKNVLGAFSDRAKLQGKPAFLNLFADKDPTRYGTIWFNGKPLIYDQICVSPGLLDRSGWNCDPETARSYADGLIQVGTGRRQPWRFGDPKNEPIGGRGYSDHLPVLVNLRVAPAAAKPE